MLVYIGCKICRSVDTKIQCSCNLTHFYTGHLLPHTLANILVCVEQRKCIKGEISCKPKLDKRLLPLLSAVVLVIIILLSLHGILYTFNRIRRPKDLSLFTWKVNDLIHHKSKSNNNGGGNADSGTAAGTNPCKVVLGYVCDSRLCRTRGQGQELPI